MRSILFALLLLGLASPANADCDTPEFAVQTFLEKAVDWSVENVADLSGAEAQPLIAWWNKMPPPSETVADRIIVLRGLHKKTGQEHPKWIFLLVKDNCVVDSGTLPSVLARSQIPAS